MFEWMSDPAAWMGLASLVLLEVVLGIDNLVFIAILADKLPPHQRDRARQIGLSLALLMRLGLLAGMSWLVTLTTPLFTIWDQSFSGRDLIMLGGGLFLLFKGTMELHERLEGKMGEHKGPKLHAGFGVVIVQIVILDAVFSLDAVITAVGMVEHLSVMMLAVTIAIGVMLIASKPLTAFVNAHPTVVILCLGFLMMIGFSLVAEGFGFHIPKGYLYAAIGFSVLIETLNQFARWNRLRYIAAARSMRERTADAVIRLLGGRQAEAAGEMLDEDGEPVATSENGDTVFQPEERFMIRSVLQLADAPIQTHMTPRPDVAWLDISDSREAILDALREHPYSRFLVAREELDELLGVVQSRDLLAMALSEEPLQLESVLKQPLIVPGGMSSLKVLQALRQHPVPLAVVVDEYGSVLGVVTTGDLLAAIAGELVDTAEDEPPVIEEENGVWVLNGSMPLDQLNDLLHLKITGDGYFTLAGLVLHHLGDIPKTGDSFEWNGLKFQILEMERFRVERIRVSRLEQPVQESLDIGDGV